jgi:hypothetical protein
MEDVFPRLLIMTTHFQLLQIQHIPSQRSTLVSNLNVWLKWLNWQANRTEKGWESLLTMQHVRFVNSMRMA